MNSSKEKIENIEDNGTSPTAKGILLPERTLKTQILETINILKLIILEHKIKLKVRRKVKSTNRILISFHKTKAINRF